MNRKRLLLTAAFLAPLWVPLLAGIVILVAPPAGVRHRLTLVRLGKVARALDARRRATGSYPPSLRSLPSDIDTRDGWKRELRYEATGGHYVLWTVSERGLRVRDGVLQDIQSPPP